MSSRNLYLQKHSQPFCEHRSRNILYTHPSAFHNCPTPDCSRFYRITPPDLALLFTCDKCKATTCTACHKACHAGLSCKASQDLLDGTTAFMEWKNKNGVHNCPACGTSIEKTLDGTHVVCPVCKTSICWRCFKTYGHIMDLDLHSRRVHGNWLVRTDRLI